MAFHPRPVTPPWAARVGALNGAGCTKQEIMDDLGISDVRELDHIMRSAYLEPSTLPSGGRLVSVRLSREAYDNLMAFAIARDIPGTDKVRLALTLLLGQALSGTDHMDKIANDGVRTRRK